MSNKVPHKRQEAFETSSGERIVIKPISPMLIQEVSFNLQETKPKPPTYKLETLGTAVVFAEHTEETVKEEGDPILEKAWEEYLSETQKWEMKNLRALVSVIILEGIDPEPYMEKAKEWVEDFAFFGLEIPTNPRKIFIEYMSKKVLSNLQDYTGLIAYSMKVSGLDGEELQKAEKMFRPNI